MSWRSASCANAADIQFKVAEFFLSEQMERQPRRSGLEVRAGSQQPATGNKETRNQGPSKDQEPGASDREPRDREPGTRLGTGSRSQRPGTSRSGARDLVRARDHFSYPYIRASVPGPATRRRARCNPMNLSMQKQEHNK